LDRRILNFGDLIRRSVDRCESAELV